MKQKLAMDENSGNVKEIVIPPEKMQEMLTLGIIILNSASRRWILITSGERFLILSNKAWNIGLLYDLSNIWE